MADGTPGIEKINFIGHRHLIDRAIEKGFLGRGSAIGFISSTAGLGWRKHLDEVKAYLEATPDFDSAVAWIEANPDKASYTWSKQTINVYVQGNAFEFLKRGIRVNAILPGPDRHAAGPRQRGDVAWASAPTTAPTPASRLLVPTSRPAPWCSSAATRRRTSAARSSWSTPASPAPAVTGTYETAAAAVGFLESM